MDGWDVATALLLGEPRNSMGENLSRLKLKLCGLELEFAGKRQLLG